MRTHLSMLLRGSWLAVLAAVSIATPGAAAPATITPSGAAIGGPRAPIATLSGIDKSIMCLEAQEYGENVGLVPMVTGKLFKDADDAHKNKSASDVAVRLDRIGTDLTQVIASEGRLLSVEIATETLYLGARTVGRNGKNTSAVPDLIYSNALWGLDAGFQEYEDQAPGSGFSLKYAVGPQVGRYAYALKKVQAARVALRKNRADMIGALNEWEKHPSVSARLSYLESHSPLFGFTIARPMDAPPITRLEAAASAVSDEAKAADAALREALVDYTLAPQASFYVTGRSYIGQGNFSAEGLTVGRLLPLHTGALYVSALGQVVQFKPSGSSGSGPTRSDGQYGFVAFWQDRVNKYEVADGKTAADEAGDNTYGSSLTRSDTKIPQPTIYLWHYKIGGEYFSKTLGQPDGYDVFFRYRFLPSYVEVTPYYGRAGQGRHEFYGVNFGVTVPMSF